MTRRQLRERARSLFLDDANAFGCAETSFLTLRDAFAVAGGLDSSVTMALNGGVAYQGEVCGAITGAAVAAGLIAGRLEPDHAAAKRRARAATAWLVEDFRREFGSLRCRELIGRDIKTAEQHDEFIASGIWKTVCMRQIEFAVDRLGSLMDEVDPAAVAANEESRP